MDFSIRLSFGVTPLSWNTLEKTSFLGEPLQGGKYWAFIGQLRDPDNSMLGRYTYMGRDSHH